MLLAVATSLVLNASSASPDPQPTFPIVGVAVGAVAGAAVGAATGIGIVYAASSSGSGCYLGACDVPVPVGATVAATVLGVLGMSVGAAIGGFTDYIFQLGALEKSPSTVAAQ